MVRRVVFLIAMLSALWLDPTPVSGQAVTVDQVIEKLDDAEEKLANLSVDCQSSTKETWHGGYSFLHYTTDGHWLCRNDGSLRYEGSVSTTTVYLVGRSERSTATAISLHNAPKQRGKYAIFGVDDLLIGQETPKVGGQLFSQGQEPPTEILLSWQGVRLSERLRQGKPLIVGEQWCAGRMAIVVRTDIQLLSTKKQVYDEFWMDMERAVVVRRQRYSRYGDEAAWKLSLQFDGLDFQQHQPQGIWLPSRAKRFQWVASEATSKLVAASHYTFENWRVNPEIADTAFALDSQLVPLLDQQIQP